MCIRLGSVRLAEKGMCILGAILWIFILSQLPFWRPQHIYKCTHKYTTLLSRLNLNIKYLEPCMSPSKPFQLCKLIFFYYFFLFSYFIIILITLFSWFFFLLFFIIFCYGNLFKFFHNKIISIIENIFVLEVDQSNF